MLTKTSCGKVKCFIIVSIILVFEKPKLHCEEIGLLLQLQRCRLTAHSAVSAWLVESSLREVGVSAVSVRSGHKPGSARMSPEAFGHSLSVDLLTSVSP